MATTPDSLSARALSQAPHAEIAAQLRGAASAAHAAGALFLAELVAEAARRLEVLSTGGNDGRR